MSELSSVRMMAITKNEQNYLYSKPENYYKASSGKNKTADLDEHSIMKRLGGTESYDLASMGENENPEKHLLNCLEKGIGKLNRSKSVKRSTKTLKTNP